MRIIAAIFLVFVIAYCYGTQKQQKKGTLRFKGKEMALPRHIAVWNIIDVCVKNGDYIADGFIRGTGEVISLPIDKDIMQNIPNEKPNGAPLLSLLLYEDEGSYSIVEKELRYKIDLRFIEEEPITQNELDYAEYIIWFLYEFRNLFITIAAIGVYQAPHVSILLSCMAFILQSRNVIPLRFTNVLDCGIIQANKTATNKVQEEKKLPPGYDSWSKNQKFLYHANERISKQNFEPIDDITESESSFDMDDESAAPFYDEYKDEAPINEEEVPEVYLPEAEMPDSSHDIPEDDDLPDFVHDVPEEDDMDDGETGFLPSEENLFDMTDDSPEEESDTTEISEPSDIPETKTQSYEEPEKTEPTQNTQASLSMPGNVATENTDAVNQEETPKKVKETPKGGTQGIVVKQPNLNSYYASMQEECTAAKPKNKPPKSFPSYQVSRDENEEQKNKSEAKQVGNKEKPFAGKKGKKTNNPLVEVIGKNKNKTTGGQTKYGRNEAPKEKASQ